MRDIVRRRRFFRSKRLTRVLLDDAAIAGRLAAGTCAVYRRAESQSAYGTMMISDDDYDDDVFTLEPLTSFFRLRFQLTYGISSQFLPASPETNLARVTENKQAEKRADRRKSKHQNNTCTAAPTSTQGNGRTGCTILDHFACITYPKRSGSPPPPPCSHRDGSCFAAVAAAATREVPPQTRFACVAQDRNVRNVGV